MTTQTQDQYLDACAQAATDQGLDPVVEALQRAGMTVTVEQTGGFTMVATVRTATHVIAMIDDTCEPDSAERTYVVGKTTVGAWDEGDEADSYEYVQGLGALVEAVIRLTSD